jgi:asparagine synthase (glutamine-hydrolysing)
MVKSQTRSHFMGELIAVLDKKGQDATEKVLSMLQVLALQKPDAYGIATPLTVKTEKTLDALQKTHIEKSHIAMGHVFSKILLTDKPQPTKHKEATLVFEGRIYPPIMGLSGIEVAANILFPNSEKAVEAFIRDVDGDFAFAIATPKKIIAGRDTIGVQPLYYGENKNFAALASVRKALWKIGIDTVHSFPPGHMALVDKKGFKFKSVKVISYPRQTQITMASAVKKLQSLIECSVRERVSELKNVAIAFSGGIDSSLIAFLAKNSGTDVQLIHVSLENQPETKHAQMVAEKLKLPLHVCLFNEEDVEETLPKVVWLVEEADPAKVSIGTSFYWTAEKTAEMGLKVLLAGQGADELFGGYKRYVDSYLRQGNEETRKKMFTDIVRLHESNIERDFKICSFHGVELHLPFATCEMAKFAMRLPTKLKIERRQDTLRKIVLRNVAQYLGLPQCIVEYPKKAVQYATGVDKTIKRLAKKHGKSAKEYLTNIFRDSLTMQCNEYA